MLRNYGVVVKCFCFREWYWVFFYSIVVDVGVCFPFCAQLFLPDEGEDAIEGCAKTHIKDINFYRGQTIFLGVIPLEKVLNSIFYVDVHCLCVGSVAGVVCLPKLGELQGGTPICCSGLDMLHFSLVYRAKLGIII